MPTAPVYQVTQIPWKFTKGDKSKVTENRTHVLCIFRVANSGNLTVRVTHW